MGAKSILKRILPTAAVLAWRRLLFRFEGRKNATLSAKDVFSAIYAENRWGGEPGVFCSGSGSIDSATREYCEFVRRFIDERAAKRVLDLGCGDFMVGSQLLKDGTHYIGIDVVPALIAHHQSRYARDNVEFFCADIVNDDLPDADLVLVRQVLQHLSNQQVKTVLSRLARYPTVLVSEHYPAPSGRFVANRDKPHGADVRVIYDSALAFDEAPFNHRNVKCVLSVPARDFLVREGETIRTFALENSGERKKPAPFPTPAS